MGGRRRRAALLEHLQGRHTLGLYPLLPDETCWLLAIDFDQQALREDVVAFVETCRGLSLPVAVERSRSGNGAHLWLFFSAPVPARLARQLGSFLLTETMSRRHQLTMASYDRLFPSQDTLPKGGFGNLIALPLQHTPRQQGNTVFLDSDFVPYPDQWAYLAAVPRLAPAAVEAIAREADRRGLVMGVKGAPAEDPERVLAQWTAQLSSCLGLAPGAIGQIGGGKDTANGTLAVAMVQSLVRRERVDDRVATYGHVVVDECHHIPAVSFERVLSAVRARFLLGLTATPQRRDGRQPITEMQLGPVRLRLSPGASTERAAFRRRLVRRETGFRLPQPDAPPPIQALYALLAADGPRNQQILDEIGALLAEGRAPLVLTERTAHLEYLAERLRERGHRVVTLRGGQSRKRRAAQAVELQADAGAGPQVVVATGRYVGEGFDCAHLDTLVLALPISWKGTLSPSRIEQRR